MNSKIQVQYLKLDRIDSDELCAHGNILTTCLRKQPCLDNQFFLRQYGSMPHYMRSHRFKMSKNPLHYVMTTLQLRFNCIQQFINTYIKTFHHLKPI